MWIKNKIIREIAAIIVAVIVILIPLIVYKYMNWDADFAYVLLLHTILIFDIMFVHQRVREWLKQK